MKKLAWLLFPVLLAVCLTCVSIGAETAAEPAMETGTCGEDVYWTLDSTGTLTISGTGPMDNWANLPQIPWAGQRGEIRTVIIEEGVTSVGQAAFSNCTELTEISLPAGLRRIEQSGFSGCTALRKISLPANLEYIGINAFYQCTALTTLHIPAKVSFVAPTAFNACTGLTAFTVAAGNSVYSAGSDGVLMKSGGAVLYRYPPGKPAAAYTVADGVSGIWQNAFANCEKLEELVLPASVQTCETDAFQLIRSLKKLTVYSPALPIDSVKFPTGLALTVCGYPSTSAQRCAEKNGYTFVSLGEAEEYLVWTFSEGVLTVSGRGPMPNYSPGRTPWESKHKQIKKVIIEEGITSVGQNAFANCTILTEVSLPSSLRRLEQFAFGNCFALSEIILPEGLQYIGDSVFNSCHALKALHIPASVTEMHTRIFLTCNALMRFTVAEGNPSYSAVDGVLFSRDGSVLYRYPQAKADTSYTVPEGVEKICENAFYYAVNLQTIHLPASVSEMDPTAFNACYGLTTITAAENSRHFLSRDGVLFTRDGTHLVRYPQARAGDAYTVPTGVTCIDYNAFARVTELKELILPIDVATLDSRAFGMHESLRILTVYHRGAEFGDALFASAKQAVEIRGYADSAAQHYAEAEGLRFTALAGDPCGKGVYWTLDSAGTLVIWGQGSMDEFLPGDQPAPWDARRGEIRRAILEDGVANLENYAFYGCSALTEVTLGADVGTVGTWAFYGCDTLRAITVDAGNKTFSSAGGVLFNAAGTLLLRFPRGAERTTYAIPHGVEQIARAAFYDCVKLTDISMPETLTAIGDSAFFGCRGLAAVSLPAALRRIETYAFAGCTGLKEIHIPAGVSEIGALAFHGCTGLRTVTVAKENPAYSAVDGILLSGDKRRLLYYPAGSDRRTYTLPAEVSSVEADAFYGSGLVEVTLPGELRSIGERAFYANTGLEQIVLPERLTDVGAQAFAQCRSLLRVEVHNPTVKFGRAVFAALPREFLLIGPAGSTAETYAADESLTFRPIGAAAPPEEN